MIDYFKIKNVIGVLCINVFQKYGCFFCFDCLTPWDIESFFIVREWHERPAGCGKDKYHTKTKASQVGWHTDFKTRIMPLFNKEGQKNWSVKAQTSDKI